MSYYPPGVTGNEPQITGEYHIKGCALHEDSEDYTEESECTCDEIAQSYAEDAEEYEYPD